MSSCPPSKCAVLVPIGGVIDPLCDASLRVLEARGYPVKRTYGMSAIDVARSLMASQALARGAEEILWIDSDIRFDPDSVEVLRSHDRDVVCGLYVKKGERDFASMFVPTQQTLTFGAGGGLVPIEYAATGFLLTRREVYRRVFETAGLPICNELRSNALVPYFMPMILESPPPCFGAFPGPIYLAEDFAFSERVRRAGFSIWADTSLRLYHVGSYGYGWEDAGRPLQRQETYTVRLDLEASQPLAVHTLPPAAAAPGVSSRPRTSKAKPGRSGKVRRSR